MVKERKAKSPAPKWASTGDVQFSDAAIDAFARLLIDVDSKVITRRRAVARMCPAPKKRK